MCRPSIRPPATPVLITQSTSKRSIIACVQTAAFTLPMPLTTQEAAAESDEEYQVVVGRVASGDQFIGTKAGTERIRSFIAFAEAVLITVYLGFRVEIFQHKLSCRII